VFLNYKAALDDVAVPPEAFLGQPISTVLPAGLAQQVLQAAEAARRTGTLHTIEYALPLHCETHHYEARSVVCGSEETMAIVRDVTARTRLEDSLRHQALHDALTGLPNRALLHDRLQQALLTAQRDHRPLALLLLNLDHFKDIYDTFGHHQGDLILQQVATRVCAARLGGDEFAVLLPTIDETRARQIAHALWTALDAPLW